MKLNHSVKNQALSVKEANFSAISNTAAELGSEHAMGVMKYEGKVRGTQTIPTPVPDL